MSGDNRYFYLHNYLIKVDYIFREKLNEEAIGYLQEFPGEMIFHTSTLHLLNMIGEGNKCVLVFSLVSYIH